MKLLKIYITVLVLLFAAMTFDNNIARSESVPPTQTSFSNQDINLSK